MTLTNFTVEFDLFSTMSDGVDDISLVPLTGSVVFTPIVTDKRPVLTSGDSPRGVMLRELCGYLDSDGQLKSSPGGSPGLRLLANDAVLGLDSLRYRVTFNVATDFGQPIDVQGGEFAAPSTDVTINLADVL